MDSTDKSFKGPATMGDRRQNKRHTFSATAEVVEIVSGARLSTRAADLSQTGCYLDSLSPFAIGSKVRVRILREGAELTCTAVVRDSQPGMGMGVAFMDLDNARKALIESWIERLGSPAIADLSPSPLSENAKPAPPPDPRDALAIQLIDLLHKKGLLSSNEVACCSVTGSCKPLTVYLVQRIIPMRNHEVSLQTLRGRQPRRSCETTEDNWVNQDPTRAYAQTSNASPLSRTGRTLRGSAYRHMQV